MADIELYLVSWNNGDGVVDAIIARAVVVAVVIVVVVEE